MIEDTALDRFHAHMDKCAQCANHPFELCPVGARLVDAAAGLKQSKES